MHWVNKGRPPKSSQYLHCDNSRRLRTCDAPSVRYKPVLDFVLDNLPKCLEAHVQSIPSTDESESRMNAIDGEIAKTEESIARLLDTLERIPSESAEKRLAEHERRLSTLKGQKVELTEQIKSRVHGNARAEFLAWYNRPVHPDQFGDVIGAEITRMNAQIRQVVSRVVIEKGQPIVVEPRAA